MAIAYQRVAHNGWGGAAGGNVTVTVTVNAGEAVIVEVHQQYSTGAGQAGLSVGSITGGGTYTKQGATADLTSGTNHWTSQIWAAIASAGASSVVVPLTGDANDVIVVVRCYSGVTSFGNNNTATGTGANPSLAVTTQDPNNYIAAGFGSGDTGPATAGTGTLRDTFLETGAQDVGSSSTDNTSASPASVTNSITLAASTWSAIAVELRSVALGPIDPGIRGTRGRPGVGPRDRRGFLKARVWSTEILVAGPTTNSGDGIAHGPSSACGSGAPIAAGAGFATAASVAFAVGVAIFSGTGSATAQSTAAAPATAIIAAAGTSTSPSTAVAPGISTASGAGVSTSPATTVGAATSTSAGAGTSQAGATVAGPGTGIASGAGVAASPSTSAAGSAGIGAGAGLATSPSSARAAGITTAAGTGVATAPASSVGDGRTTASGTGASTGLALVTAAGVANTPGDSGASLGISTARATGASTAAGAGAASGSSSARAASSAIASQVGTSSSRATATGEVIDATTVTEISVVGQITVVRPAIVFKRVQAAVAMARQAAEASMKVVRPEVTFNRQQANVTFTDPTAAPVFDHPAQRPAITVVTKDYVPPETDDVMPIQRSDLLLEFIPARDDATATKVGTPTLRPDGNGYDFGSGDSIALDRALMDRVLNEGSRGFTILVAVQAVAGLVGTNYTLLSYTDPSVDGAVFLSLVQGADGAHVRLSAGLSYNPTDYEGVDNAGAIALGPHVVGLRFVRTAPIGSRVSLWVDGQQITGTSYDPTGSVDPDTLAGTIDTYGDGTVSLGDDPNSAAAPNSPAGSVFGWSFPLSDIALASAAGWVAAAYPVGP